MSGTGSLASRIQFDDLYNGSFIPEYQKLEWIKTGDGMLVQFRILIIQFKNICMFTIETIFFRC